MKTLLSLILRVSPVLIGIAIGVFGVNFILVLLGGIRIEVGNFIFRSTTIEFPIIAFFVSIFLFLIVKGRGREAIVLGLALCFSSILAEGFLRLTEHPLAKPYLRSYIEPSSVLGTRLVPGFDGFGPLDVAMKVNSQGFRDREHKWEKEPGTFRIIGVGDSFTFGWGIAQEETFLRRLEANLEMKTKEQFETINAGVPGWGLNSYYLFLEHVGKRYAPDVVIVAYYVDDMSSPKPSPASSKPRQLNFEGGFLHHSYFYNFLKSLCDQLRFRNRKMQEDYLSDLFIRRQHINKRKNYLLSSTAENPQDENKAVLEKHIARINQVTIDMGSSLILMLIPDAAQLHHREVQLVNKILAEYTNQNNIPFLDMTQIFEQSPDLQTYFFVPRDWHTNILGHQKMAEALTPLVCQALKVHNVKCREGVLGAEM